MNNQRFRIILFLWVGLAGMISSLHADVYTTANYTLCPSETLTIGDTTISAAGIYSLIYQASDGTDSIVDVLVTYQPDYLFEEHRDLLHGETMVWRGLLVDGSKSVYYDRYKTINGCDSIYQLNVTTFTKQPQYFRSDTVRVCRSAFPFIWKGMSFPTAGTYYDIHRSVYGTDSIESLTIVEVPTAETRETLYICKGNSVTLPGVGEIAAPGIYTANYLTSSGCDSLHTYVVNYLPSFEFVERRNVQEGGLVAWHGQTHYPTENTTYYDYHSTVMGCDSNYVLEVTVVHPTANGFLIENEAAICKGDSYLWRGKNYWQSGTYYDSLRTTDNSKDSVYCLHLVVRPTFVSQQLLRFCEGGSVSFLGHTFTDAGVFRDTLLSSQGCDSIVEILVQEDRAYRFREDVTISDQQLPYRWRGQELTATGTYRDDYQTINGCDSVYEVSLTVCPTYLFEDAIVLCENELPYLWRGNTITHAGVYTDHYSTVMGYDSIYRLNLKVAPVYRMTQQFTICEGEQFVLHGKVYKEPCVFSDTLLSAAGCDSIVTTVLNVTERFVQEDTVVINDEQLPYLWHGQIIMATGTYRDEHQSVNGCDSTYIRYVRILPTYRYVTEASICATEVPYLWRGGSYNSSGVYHSEFQTVDGQDSIYQLNLTVHPVLYHTEHIGLCEGSVFRFKEQNYTADTVLRDTILSSTGCDSITEYIVQFHAPYYYRDTLIVSTSQLPIVWHGQTLDISGTYEAAYQSVNGCDSVYNLYLTVHPAHTIIKDTAICESDVPYMWRGRAYYNTGIYSEPYMTTQRYDSIYQLRLTVNPVSRETHYFELCPGGSVHVNGYTFTSSGIYTDTISTEAGCDSVITYVVTEAPAYKVSDTLHISDQETRTWRGQYIRLSGTYTDTYTSVSGCDSVFELVAYVHPTYLFETDTMICMSPEPLVWRGNSYSRSGNHIIEERYTTVWGYDSIYRLRFDTYPQYRYTQQLNICEGSSAWFGGKEYSATGTYVDSLLTVDGCDSIITVVVNMSHRFFSADTVHISNRDTVRWHGQVITKSGTYTDMHHTSEGCDSIYQRYVVVHPTYIYQTDTAICQTEAPFHWRGRDYDQIGSFTYEDAYLTEDGYDSIYRLNLTVYPVYTFNHHIQLCEGQYEVFHGTKYTAAGEYVDTLRSSTGCDSICYVHVNILDSYYSEDHIGINDNQSYTWTKNGQTYTEPGVYELYEKTVSGCDSIMRLFLTRNPKYLLEESAEICEPDTLPFFVWRGHEYNQSGRYYDSLQTVAGQDSVYQLDLVIHPRSFTPIYKDICEDETFSFNGRIITESGVYNDTLTTVYGCDSVLQLSINFHKYEITHMDTICDGDTVWWYGVPQTREGFYPVRHPNANGCDSIFNLNLTVLYNIHRNYSDTICEDKLLHNEPYLFGPNQQPLWGKWNSVTRHYEDSIYWNCDHTHTFHLVVLPERRSVDTTEICEGDSVWFHRHDGSYMYVYQSGNYYDTIPSPGTDDIYSCDSIVCHHVKVNPTSRDSLVRHISDKDSIYFANRYLSKTGVYRDTLPTAYGGCDSITVLNLYVDTTYYFSDSIRICQPHYFGPSDPRNTPYIWVGHRTADKRPYEIYNSGIYWDSLLTVNTHVDSIYCLKVDVYPVSFESRSILLCEGDSVRFGNRWISRKGIYKDTLVNAYGCDSIIQLTVNMLPSYHKAQTAHISDKEQYIWLLRDHTGAYDRTLAVGGNYHDTLQTREGCDSIVSLTLYVHPTYYIADSVSVCQSDLPYIWAGHLGNKHLYSTGVYYDSLRTIAGYDSIHSLTLRVLPSYKQRLVFSTCAGDSIRYNNKVYTHPGVYYDTLHTADMCDSILVIDYQWRDKYLVEKTAQTADNIPYVWTEGTIRRVLTTAGVYYDTLQAVTGCDSIISLTLSVYPTYHYVEQATVCAGDLPYEWHRRQLYDSGIYYDSLQTVQHYDSIYTFFLTVKDTTHTDVSVRLCYGERITINGITYSQAGTIVDTLFTYDGCDSIVYTHIQVLPRYFFSDTVTTTSRSPYLWHGKSFTHSGVYYDSLKSVTSGCDSVYQLVLTVEPAYIIRDTTVWVCESELPFRWHGQSYNESLRFADTVSVNGVDSIWRVNLIVNALTSSYVSITLCEGESLSYNGREYGASTPSGLYRDTIRNAVGCDSVIYISFRYFAAQTICTSAAISDQETYTWEGHNLRLSRAGVYYDTVRSVSGCDSVRYQLTLNVYPTYHRDTSIVICRADAPLLFGGRTYDSTGVYVDTMQTVMRYDSIWTIRLTIHEMEYEHIEKQLCKGDVFYYRSLTIDRDTFFYDTIYSGMGCGKITLVDVRYRYPRTVLLSAQTSTRQPYIWSVDTATYTLQYSGIYTHVVPTYDGQCDSIVYRLSLSVYPTYEYRDSLSVCQSDLPYIWHGKMLYDVGVYYDSLRTVQGYDSIYSLKILSILPSYYQEQTIDLCTGGVFYYRGKAYSENGIFYDTIPSLNGCDSVFKITVRIFPSYERTDTVHVADGEVYDFNGRLLTKTGLYHDYLKSAAGCDSVQHLYLFVHPSYHFYDSVNLCEKDTFYWHNQELTQTGIYYDSLLTAEGYDSVYTLTLQVYPTYFREEYHEICPGHVIYVHGINITQPGVYMDTLLSRHGCDSVFKIVVNQTRSYRQTYTYEICQGDSVYFDGAWRRSTGDYYRTIGCDSIIQMHLVVHERTITDKRVVVCDEELPYFYRGVEYTQSGTYVDTLYSSFGCDSIVRLTLLVTPYVSDWEAIPLCPGQMLRIGADTITKAGLYTFVRRSVSTGLLDSLYRVEVYDAPAFDFPTETIHTCQGDTVYYGGRAITRAGHYDFSLKTADGCDSLLHLDLYIHPVYQYYEDATIADYQSYLWRGTHYTRAGEYSYTLPTIHNCDSTYTLRLTVLPTDRIAASDTICIGSQYLWRGQTLSNPGFYTDTMFNVASSTSLIYSLDLDVVAPTYITSAAVDDVCADQESFAVRFTYSGAEPTTYNIYFDQAAHQAGFDDIYNHPFGQDMSVEVPMPKKSGVLYNQHTDYVRPDNYTLRLVLDNGVCGFSKSDTLSMLVKYPNWIIEQNWNDVVSPLKAEYNGGYQFGLYDWYVNGQRQPNNGSSYLYSPQLRAGDEVVLYATRIGESYAIPTCPLTIIVPQEDIYSTPIMVYPTVTSKRRPAITHKAYTNGQYKIFSSTGHLAGVGEFESGETEIVLPYVEGCYIIQSATSDGRTYINKVVVY